MPLLILHGARDRVIPVEMGKRLYAAANQPKRLEVFPDGDHNDLFDHGAWDKARAFLQVPDNPSKPPSDRRFLDPNEAHPFRLMGWRRISF